MTMQELSTLTRAARLPVKIFIFDNGALRMIKNLQNISYGGRLTDSLLSDNPDFEIIGRAYGIKSVRLDVSRRNSLCDDISGILENGEHMIVRCMV